jgi:hypothetical protein
VLKVVNGLTDVKVRNAEPAASPRELFDGRGLFLLVAPGGGKWWRFKYSFAGKAKLLSLGVYPDVGLKEPRDRREQARRLLASGIDPSAERKATKEAQVAGGRREQESFEAVAREWLEKSSPGWAAVMPKRLSGDWSAMSCLAWPVDQ